MPSIKLYFPRKVNPLRSFSLEIFEKLSLLILRIWGH